MGKRIERTDLGIVHHLRRGCLALAPQDSFRRLEESFIMKREYKTYRIVSENGETLLIPKRHFHCLMQTLDVLANGAKNGRNRRRRPRNRNGVINE